nr:neuronal acetylcholine receptor subunit beta-3-like isoform X2 [Crassostrea gigas]
MTRCLIKEYYFSTNRGTMKVLLSVLCLLYAVEGYTLANKTKLHQDLFTNYKSKFRPGEDQIIPTELMFSFYIRSLKERQESNEIMVVVGSLGLEWKDFRLSWNPLDYGGDLNQTFVLVDDIWTPYLVLMNPYEEVTPILSDGFSCEVWYNGHVSCLPPPNIFESLCVADTTYYPYDTKSCDLLLYVSGYPSSDLKLKPVSKTLNTDMYRDNGPWNMTNTGIIVFTQHIGNKSFEISEFKIQMKRRPGTYILQISPIFVLSFMQVLVFVLPDESGERIGFSITIFLTEIVFLTVFQENLPKASASFLPYLIYKQLIDVLISLYMLFGVVFASICYDKEKKEPKKTEKPKKTEEPKKTGETPVGVALTTDTSIKRDEEKPEEPKKIEETTKNEEIPGKIEKTKFIWPSGKRVDFAFGSTNLLFMIVINAYLYGLAVSKE